MDIPVFPTAYDISWAENYYIELTAKLLGTTADELREYLKKEREDQ